MHMIIHKVLQGISPLSWNCYTNSFVTEKKKRGGGLKRPPKQQNILGWNLSYSWECKPESIQHEGDLQKTGTSHNSAVNTLWWTFLQQFLEAHHPDYVRCKYSHSKDRKKLVHWEYSDPYARSYCTTQVWRNTTTWKKKKKKKDNDFRSTVHLCFRMM